MLKVLSYSVLSFIFILTTAAVNNRNKIMFIAIVVDLKTKRFL